MIMKIPFSALSNRGKESSRERKLEKTNGQHDGCLLGEILFFFRSPKHCKRVYLVPTRGWLLFIKFCSHVKFQVIIKIMPKGKDLGFR